MSGIAGYKAQIRLGGTPTSFTGQALTRLQGRVHRIADPVKRVLSANHSVIVRNSSNVIMDVAAINYLEGIIILDTFVQDNYTIAAHYIPLEYVGGSKDYSLEIGGDVLDDTAFHTDSQLSAGYRTKICGIHDIKANIGRWNNFNGKLIDAKLAQTPVFVSINPGGSKVSIKGWFQIETDSLSGDIGSLEEEAVSLALCGNNSQTYFSYCYDYTDEETESIYELDLVSNYFLNFVYAIPESITITGITDPVSSDPLVVNRVADYDNRPKWDGIVSGVTYYLLWQTQWRLTDSSESVFSSFSPNSITATPIGLTDWDTTLGEGELVLSE